MKIKIERMVEIKSEGAGFPAAVNNIVSISFKN